MEEIKNGGEEERKEAVISTTYDSVDNLDIKLVLSNSSRIWLPFQSSPLFSLLSSRSFSSLFLFPQDGQGRETKEEVWFR